MFSFISSQLCLLNQNEQNPSLSSQIHHHQRKSHPHQYLHHHSPRAILGRNRHHNHHHLPHHLHLRCSYCCCRSHQSQILCLTWTWKHDHFIKSSIDVCWMRRPSLHLAIKVYLIVVPLRNTSHVLKLCLLTHVFKSIKWSCTTLHCTITLFDHNNHKIKYNPEHNWILSWQHKHLYVVSLLFNVSIKYITKLRSF